MPPRAYYNENDPLIAGWLRELIARGAVADGEVDTRSIVDVRPDDLRGFTQCHFFAGIGGWSYAARLAGWPDDRELWTGSCPCQPWSMAGAGEGTTDPRHLWPAWFPLIRERRPAALFGEQVASKDGEFWLDLVLAQMEGIDYAIGSLDLPAAGVGSPNRRQRFWIVADDNRRRRALLGAARLHERRPGPLGGAAAAGAADGARGLDADRRGAAGVLADAVRDGAGQHAGELPADEGQHDHRSPRGGDAPLAGRPAGDVADPARRRQRADGRAPGRAGHPDQRGAAGRVGDPDGQQRRGRRAAARPDGQAGDAAALAGRVEHAGGEGLQGHRGHEPDGDQPGWFGARQDRPAAATGPTSGFWFPCDWIPCSDGKARPVEPGTFPLADGVPARVGRLRGYGNAINPWVAAEVIRAYMEIRE